MQLRMEANTTISCSMGGNAEDQKMEYASGEEMESDDDRPPLGAVRPAEGAIKYGDAQLGSDMQAGTAAGNIHMQQDDAETLELEMASCCVTQAC